MASVALEFVPPEDPDLVAMVILEAASPLGPFDVIETVTDIGSAPGYIDHYTTDLASGATNWFTIQWRNAKGAVTDMSAPVMGGTETLVGLVIERVRQRDRSIDEHIIKQEAEGAVEFFFSADPYSVDLSDVPAGRQYRTLNGLTYLTLARIYLALAGTTKNIQSATMGIVSFRSESGSQRSVDVQALIDLANMSLGISTSLIVQLEDIFNPDAVNYFFSNVSPVNVIEP